MPLLYMETTPTATMIYDCWDKIDADPAREVFLADTHPHSAVEFLALSGTMIVPCIAFMRHDPAALIWLSQILLLTPKMTPFSAQLHLYLLPAWRGRAISPPCAALFREGLASYGFRHLAAAVRLDDVETLRALDACDFTRQGILPRWQCYAGIWHDIAIYDYHFDQAS